MSGARAALTKVWVDRATSKSELLMHVLLGPLICRRKICRVVSPMESLVYVEEWIGSDWVPSDIPLHAIEEAVPATVDMLAACNVPTNDWGMIGHSADAPASDPHLLLLAMQLVNTALGVPPKQPTFNGGGIEPREPERHVVST